MENFKISTIKMSIEEIIQATIDICEAKNYLEIGSKNDDNFDKIVCLQKMAVGFQVYPLSTRINELYFDQPADNFFSAEYAFLRNNRPDVVLIHGQNYGQSLRDVKNAVDHLRPGGVIFLTDSNPLAKCDRDLDHDVWKAILYLRSFRWDLKIFTDNELGLGIIVKEWSSGLLGLEPQKIADFTRQDLECHLNEWLDPVLSTYFLQWLKETSLSKQIVGLKRSLSEHRKKISDLERSVVWVLLQKFHSLINFLLPQDSGRRAVYDRAILLNQFLFNGDFAEFSRFWKRWMEKKSCERFWRGFWKSRCRVDILFINHEETRTGAPQILFEIIKKISGRFSTGVVSLAEGSRHEDFMTNFSDVIYPQKLYLELHPKEQAREILIRTMPAVVYVNTVVGHHFARAAKELGLPVICHVHELGFSFDKVFNSIERKEFPLLADKFIAVSGRVAEYLIEEIKCPREKVTIVNDFICGVEAVEKSKFDQLGAGKDIGRETGEIVVAGMGSFSWRKGGDLFTEAYKILGKQYPGRFRFVWIGSYSDSDSLPIEKDLLDGRLIFTGEKINPLPYVALADIFVLSSREDSFALVMQEAMALGKPIVAFQNSGGAREALGDCGVLSEEMTPAGLALAIDRLTRDPEMMRRCGEKAIIAQKQFDYEAAMPKIEELIENFYPLRNGSAGPKISVIITSFNYGWCLPETINSVLYQTYGNWELLIVDDFSSDDSAKIIRDYVKKYPNKIRAIFKENHKEKGIIDSYRLGIANATGEYIVFLEADDKLYSDSLAVRAKILNEQPETVLVYNDAEIFGDQTSVNRKKSDLAYFYDINIPLDPFVASVYLKELNIILSLSQVMVRKNVLDQIDFTQNKFDAWFDWWFYTQVSVRGKFLHLPLKKTLWRVHRESNNERFRRRVDAQEELRQMRSFLLNYLDKNVESENLAVIPPVSSA